MGPGARRVGLSVLSAALVAWVASSATVAAQEAWGYLWEVRTMQLYPLAGESVRLGRLPESDVVLSDTHVSRRHAEIRKEPEGIVLVDLRSTNGTYLNGKKLLPGRAYPLRPGDFVVLAVEGFIYHEDKMALWRETLGHTLLARFVRLRVPVLKDRTSRSLGKERVISSATEVAADPETGEVEVRQTFSGTGTDAFQPGESVFVGGAEVREGALRLSLWGLNREGGMVSRRAAFSQMDHGELAVTERRASGDGAGFEERWRENGVVFLAPIFSSVLERYPSDEEHEMELRVSRSLIDRGDPQALRDAASVLEYLHSLKPEDVEIPLLVVRARTELVSNMARERRLVLDEGEREALRSSLEQCKEWIHKAKEMGADDQEVELLEAHLARAEALVTARP